MTVHSAPQAAKGFQCDVRWPLVSFGDVASLHYGKGLPERSRRPGTIPVYGSNGQCGWHDTALGQGPTVVLGRKGQGPLGVEWCQSPFWVIDTAYYVTVDCDRVDLRYFYYVAKYVGLNHLKDGTSNPTLSRDVFGQQGIPLPPLRAQRAILSILSAYDDLIENCQRRIKLLESMARALYREWFVHFRFPGHDGHRRVASLLGEIPNGWQVKKLGEVLNVVRGRSYRSSDLVDEGGLPFVNLKCIDREGGFRRSGIKRYSGEFKETQLARKGDVIVAVTDMTQERRIVARPAIVPTLDQEFGVISMDLVRVEPAAGLGRAFLYSLLRYSSFADEVKQHANGANVLHLSPDRIVDYRFVEPSSELVASFEGIVQAVFSQVDLLESKAENLRGTRDLLLPRLLSGQIDVGAA